MTTRHTHLSLPAYRHIPGKTAHPTRTPEGHSYRPDPTAQPPLPDLNKTESLSCEHFLFGVDLFNNGAHLGLDLIGMLADTGAFVTDNSVDPARLYLKTDQQSHHGEDLD